jgi:hypothetical protein
MEQIRLRESRFHESAFLFVLASLEFLQSRLPSGVTWTVASWLMQFANLRWSASA